MPRYAVHMIPTDPLWQDVDPVLIALVNAATDQLAELNARALAGVACDVQEIEEVEE
jgi:hypothetical protein